MHAIPKFMNHQAGAERPLRRTGTILALVLLGLFFAASAQGQGVPITSGHSGYWYEPQRDGEGWALEVLDTDRVLLYWFTYDEEGHQRWLTAVGDIVQADSGERIEFPHLVKTSGGRFGPDFDADQIEHESVGEARLTFNGCDAGTLEYSAFGQTQSLSIQRLTHAMATRCESLHGVPGRAATEHAGLSGSWFDPSHNGEGYALQWIDPQRALITWFSFDPEGNPYWMHGVGELDGDGDLQAPLMHATRGGRFGGDFNPDDVERFLWGELTLALTCEGGPANYASVLAPFGSGQLDLVQMTGLRSVACPWQPPALNALYDIAVLEPPATYGDDEKPVTLSAMSDDGRVFGLDAEGQVYVWTPGTDALERLPDGPAPNGPVGSVLRVSGDGSTVVLRAQYPDQVAGHPVNVWRAGEGWVELTDIHAGRSDVSVYGLSHDGSQLVGTGRTQSDGLLLPWLWNAATGVTGLSVSDSLRTWWPLSASNDGALVVGNRVGWVPGFGWMARPGPAGVVVQIDGSAPEFLHDLEGRTLGPARACAAECSIITGASDYQHGNGLAWLWSLDGTYVEIPAPATSGLPTSRRYLFPDTMAADGTLVAGTHEPEYIVDDLVADTFVWGQLTGSQSLHDLDIGFTLGDWRYLDPIGMSKHGEYILLQVQAMDQHSGWLPRLLHLQAKQKP